MKLSYKLILGYLIVASIAGSATYFALRSYNNIEAAFTRLMSDPVPTVKALNDLKNAGRQIVSAANEDELTFIESGNLNESERKLLQTKAEQEFLSAGRQYDETLNAYAELIASQGEYESEALRNITKNGRDMIGASAEIVEMKKTSRSGKEFLNKRLVLKARESQYFHTIDEAIAHENGQVDGERELVKSTIAASTYTTLGVSLLTLALAAGLGLYISRSIAGRISKLKTASENIGHGELQTMIKVESDDEIGALTRSFNQMIGNLQTSRTELLTSKNFVDNIVSSIADSLIVLDMNLRIVRVNRAALKLTGFAKEELIDRPIHILRNDGGFFNDRDVAELRAKNYVSGIETFLQAKDGQEIPVLFSASSMRETDGAETGIVCLARDITVRKELERQLTHQALHDPLTGLANRLLFGNRVEHALEMVMRNREPVAVMFLDLDNFKTINDTLGHEAGDQLLISVAERLTVCLRPGDTVARLGGDEFAVLIENIKHFDEVSSIAERISDVLQEPFEINGREIPVRASIGIAVKTNGNENTEDLLRHADLAMYKAKSQGKNRHAFFEIRMHEDLIERTEFEAELRRGIGRGEFVLHYQPIIDLRSEEIIGMEALVRWNHPVRGLIPPLKFIPVAEETGLIVPLGKWVLEEACRQARKWQTSHADHHDLSITVNLANRQIQEDDLVRLVAEALTGSGLPARNLILEITESTMLQDTEATIRKLTKLKELGVRLAIDDFGTGYSSLSYLQRFPIDVLKIDKSFVDKINQGKEGAAVARAIITMSETLHLKTIAEGIETDGQNLTLQNLGCRFGQGYHFAKPLTPEAMSGFLKRKSSQRPEELPPDTRCLEFTDVQAKNVSLKS